MSHQEPDRSPLPLDPELQKQAVKEALHEWLDEAFAAFGKWTFMGLMAAAFTGLIYLMLVGMGWHK